MRNRQPKQQGIIRFSFPGGPIRLENRTALKRFLVGRIRREGFRVGQIQFVFVSRDGLLDLNRRFLQHDFHTDILTFPLSASGPLVADIFISPWMVRENAELFQTSFRRELHRVIFHGILHLCGFNDKTPAERKRMRAMEDAWLNAWLGEA